MKKEKLPPKEGKDDASKNFVEITVPDVSGIKEKVDSALDKVGERVIEKGIMDRFSDDMALMFEKDRVGLDPSYARMGISIAVASIVMVALMLYAGAPLWIFGFLAFMLLLCVALVFLGKYEIRYDPDGFSVRLGKKEHRRYAWTDITDVQDGKKVFVKGKRLFADPSMHGFDKFYRRARVSCKGKGKTVLSEKKRKNRQKLPTPKRK
jgi:hypothetical protein